MNKFFTMLMTIVFTASTIVSCGKDLQKTPPSESNQAALACVVTGPAAPACAVTVTGIQWAIMIFAGGALVGTAYVASSASQVSGTYKGYSYFAKKAVSYNASCNVAGTAPHCQGKRVTGSGPTCTDAKRDATQKAPAGCYARHCKC